MLCVWEHIYGLYFGYAVVCVQQVQVACLRGGVAAHIDDAFGVGTYDDINDILVHTGTWRVGNDDIRVSVFADEVCGQDILHIAGIELGLMAQTIQLGIHFGILDCLGNVFDTDNF